MNTAERLRFVVKNSGLKQKIIAERAGYSEKQLSALVTGRKKMYAEDVTKICIALNITPNQLYGYEEQPV